MMGRLVVLGFRASLALALPIVVLLGAERLAARLDPGTAPSRFDADRGYQLFTSRCVVCHAESPGDLGRMGPNLASVGAAAPTRRPGLSGPAYVLESILDPAAFRAPGAKGGAAMPQGLVADLSDDDVLQLVAYVSRKGARVPDREIAKLAVERPEFGVGDRLVVERSAMDRGMAVFRARCESCHAVHNRAEYRVRAPALFGVGLPADGSLRDALRHAGSSPELRAVTDGLDDADLDALEALVRTLQ
jgi:mono/diheme cytochrome c family protein